MSRRQGFWSVAFAFTAVMAYSAIPTPLYVIYGFSPFTTTIVFAAYAVGVVGGLFLAGHVSDWYGRRRVLVPALALSLVSGVFFLAFRDAGWLVPGRVMNGVSVGIVAATATAWLQELGGGGRRSEVVATAANLGGIGLGPLLAGVLAQWVGAPLVVPYVVSLAALALGTLLVCFAPETRELRPQPYRPQRVSVPHAARAQYFAACTGAAISFATFGLFTSLAPRFLAVTLHHGSRALAGATACAVFGAAVVAQLLTASRSRRELLAGGMAVVPLGLTLVVLAVWLPEPSLDLFLLGGVLGGAGGGLLFKGGVMTVSAIAAEEHRAEALAGLFLVGYIGLAVPVIGLGILTEELSVRTSLLLFAGLLGGGVAAAAPALLRRRDPLRAVP
jgi:MFS family permease